MWQDYLTLGRALSWLDVFAVAFFAAGWTGYAAFAKARARATPSLQGMMDGYRRSWMARMVERDNRMVDVNVLRNLTRSSQFFASTTMVILGALIALMGYVQRAADVVAELPFVVKASERLLELKIVLLIVIFVYAFFKLSWSIRQFNFCSILVGATPKVPEDAEEFAPQINRIARIVSYASANFNYGLRAYYFGLAAFTWFLHPWVMIVASAWVVYVLYLREFRSRTLKALVEEGKSSSLTT